jgi:hypothetical protein
LLEGDRQPDLGLEEGGVALGDDAPEQQHQEGKADGDGDDAVHLEAAFGGVALLDPDVATGGGLARRAGAVDGRVGHSYCSRYLRTM